MRQATYEEIQRIADAMKDQKEFRDIIGFAVDAYGEAVHRVVLETDHNFDDGAENRYLTGIAAYDKDGKKLSYDFTLPYWQQMYYQTSWNITLGEQIKKDPSDIGDYLPEVDLSQFDSIWNIEYLRDQPGGEVKPLWIEE